MKSFMPVTVLNPCHGMFPTCAARLHCFTLVLPLSLCQPESLKLIKQEPIAFFALCIFKVSNKYEKKLDMKYM